MAVRRGIASTTACTAERSASPEYVGGVPTATNSSRARSSAGPRSVEKCRPLAVLGDQRGQSRLPDRRLTVLERADLLRIDVDAEHLGPERGEARRGDEADVAGADHADRLSVVSSAHGGRRVY
jgi:hypothetical protein